MTLTSSVPVLRVADYPRARAFWRDVVGFGVVEEAGVPVTVFGIFRLGKAEIFLTGRDGPEAHYDGWRAYFHTDDLAAISARLTEKGQSFDGPTVTEYGMCEVKLTDPDGNVICFGQDAG